MNTYPSYTTLLACFSVKYFSLMQSHTLSIHPLFNLSTLLLLLNLPSYIFFSFVYFSKMLISSHNILTNSRIHAFLRHFTSFLPKAKQKLKNTRRDVKLTTTRNVKKQLSTPTTKTKVCQLFVRSAITYFNFISFDKKKAFESCFFNILNYKLEYIYTNKEVNFNILGAIKEVYQVHDMY